VTYWLIIERFENWEVDAANNFSFFGLSHRYRKLGAEIAAKDLVFGYVSSGRSAFADIRMVRETGLKRLKVQSYDSAFAYFFSTTPVLVLPRKSWVALKDIASELDLTRARTDYRPLFQTSIRKLNEHDAVFLQGKLRQAEKSS
jgi:hypothetical protein